MIEDFLCKCGHKNKMHITEKDALKYRHHVGRMCIEYKYYPDVWTGEICNCNDFMPDNLRTLESKI